MKKVFPVASSGSNIISRNSPVEGREIRDASRICQKSPVERRENCPNCGSANLSTGAGRKPSEMSLKCGECRAFIGYKNLEKLNKLKRQKRLTPCLELLEKQGLTGDAAIFILSQVGGVK